MKFKIVNFVYRLFFRIHLYRVCGWLYPLLMKTMLGYTTEDGITVTK